MAQDAAGYNGKEQQNSHKQCDAAEGGRVGCCNANEAGAIISALHSTQSVHVKDSPKHSGK